MKLGNTLVGRAVRNGAKRKKLTNVFQRQMLPREAEGAEGSHRGRICPTKGRSPVRGTLVSLLYPPTVVVTLVLTLVNNPSRTLVHSSTLVHAKRLAVGSAATLAPLTHTSL